MAMDLLIHRLRFGKVAVESLSDNQLLEVLDFNLPHDVMDLCLRDICRRRNINLDKLSDAENEPT